MRQELALVLREQREEPELVRRQRDCAGRRDERPLLEVDVELADSTTGFLGGVARRSAARSRASSSSIPNGFVT